MKHALALLARGGLVLGLLAGCAAQAPPTDPSQMAQANMQADVSSLKSRTQEMRARLEDIETQMGRKGQGLTLEDVNQRLTRLEDVVTRLAATLGVDPGTRPSAPSAASSAAPTAAPAASSPAYAAPAASPGYAPPAASGGQAVLGANQDPYARYQPPTPLPRAQQMEDDPPPILGGSDSSAPDEAIYNMGMESFSQRDYDRANTLFSELIKSYPKSRQAPTALFWQAESNYQQGDYGRAALLCQDLIQKYPSHALVASAMLKQALCFRKLNKAPAAKIVLQDVVKRFPGTPEGRSAQAQLKELK